MADIERRVSLEVERLRCEDLWRDQGTEYLSLSVAAAIAFHQAHSNTNAIVSFDDYNDALNIAASALSRLIRIHSGEGRHQADAALKIDLTRERFSRGATVLVASNGTSVDKLRVRRTEFRSALALIRQTGLPFSFAFGSTPQRSAESERPAAGQERESGEGR